MPIFVAIFFYVVMWFLTNMFLMDNDWPDWVAFLVSMFWPLLLFFLLWTFLVKMAHGDFK